MGELKLLVLPGRYQQNDVEAKVGPQDEAAKKKPADEAAKKGSPGKTKKVSDAKLFTVEKLKKRVKSVKEACTTFQKIAMMQIKSIGIPRHRRYKKLQRQNTNSSGVRWFLNKGGGGGAAEALYNV